MELVHRDVVHTVRVNHDDITNLAALLEQLDRFKLSHPDIATTVLRHGLPTLARLVALID